MGRWGVVGRRVLLLVCVLCSTTMLHKTLIPRASSMGELLVQSKEGSRAKIVPCAMCVLGYFTYMFDMS
jgi:hypothetical protein